MRKLLVAAAILGLLALAGCKYIYMEPTDPVAVIVASPLEGPPPLDVYFDASGSNPSTGAQIVDYRWDFGDGSLGEGVTVTHTYAHEGTYMVTLEIEDSAHKKATSSVTIQVHNAPPVIYSIQVIGEHGSGPFRRGERITFIANADDPDGYIRWYYWDFGDGHVGQGEVVEHAYYPAHCGSTPETYIVTLTVEDNTGLRAMATVSVEVTCH